MVDNGNVDTSQSKILGLVLFPLLQVVSLLSLIGSVNYFISVVIEIN